MRRSAFVLFFVLSWIIVDLHISFFILLCRTPKMTIENIRFYIKVHTACHVPVRVIDDEVLGLSTVERCVKVIP